MKPSEICKLIKRDFGIDIKPNQLRHWEEYGIIGDIKYTGKEGKRQQRDFSASNIRKIKQVVLLKELLRFDNATIKAFMDGNMVVQKEVFNRLDILENIISHIAKEVLIVPAGEDTKKA